MAMLRKLLRADQGQDLIEYTLLLAFLALGSSALYLGSGGSIKKIWQTADTTVASAAVTAGASAPSSATDTPPPPGGGGGSDGGHHDDGYHQWH